MGSINTYPKNRHIEGIGKVCWYCPYPVATIREDDGYDTNTTYDCPLKRCIVPGFEMVTRYKYHMRKIENVEAYRNHWKNLSRKEKKELRDDILKRIAEHRPR